MDTDLLLNCLLFIASVIFGLLLITSTLFGITHFYKFFRSPINQTLATKNLTFYTFFLLLFYFFVMLKVLDEFIVPIARFEGDDGESSPRPDAFIFAYLMLQTSFVKFIIAVDIFWCFRKISKFLQRSSGSKNWKFLAYCLCGTLTPLFYTVALFLIMEPKNFWEVDALQGDLLLPASIVRIARLIPILGAFWYIRAASIDKSELWTKFSLHIRFLIMLGGFSAIVSATELVLFGYTNMVSMSEPDTFENALDWYSLVHYVGMTLEGVFIGIFFTFRKDTFEPISTTSSSYTS